MELPDIPLTMDAAAVRRITKGIDEADVRGGRARPDDGRDEEEAAEEAAGWWVWLRRRAAAPGGPSGADRVAEFDALIGEVRCPRSRCMYVLACMVMYV